MKIDPIPYLMVDRLPMGQEEALEWKFEATIRGWQNTRVIAIICNHDHFNHHYHVFITLLRLNLNKTLGLAERKKE